MSELELLGSWAGCSDEEDHPAGNFFQAPVGRRRRAAAMGGLAVRVCCSVLLRMVLQAGSLADIRTFGSHFDVVLGVLPCPVFCMRWSRF